MAEWTIRMANWRTAALAAALLLSGEAHAQSSGGGPLNFLDNLFTGAFSKGGQTAPSTSQPSAAQTQSPPPAGSGPLPWSGEDGASGHPLMTASAIREAGANFDNCVAAMWPD